jgi:hypothetical protein
MRAVPILRLAKGLGGTDPASPVSVLIYTSYSSLCLRFYSIRTTVVCVKRINLGETDLLCKNKEVDNA